MGTGFCSDDGGAVGFEVLVFSTQVDFKLLEIAYWEVDVV
jgi:hypothetical protein